MLYVEKIFRSRFYGSMCFIILPLALWLRWPWPDGFLGHLDERAFVLQPLGFWSGDLNPHFFNYPTLQFYFVSILYYLYYLLFSYEDLATFIAYRYFINADDLLQIARGTNVLFALGTVVVTAQIGRRLYGCLGGLASGFLLAVMPLHVRYSHLAITDVPALFWFCLSILYSVRVIQHGYLRDWVVAGVSIGLAAATKYPAGMVAVAIFVAGICRSEYLKGLWIAALIALLTFSAATPYVWIDIESFLRDFASMSQEHIVGSSHSGTGPSWLYILRYHLYYGIGWTCVAAFITAMIWHPTTLRREEWMLLVTLGAYALVLAFSSSVFMRYSLPIAPLFAVLAVRILQLKIRKTAIFIFCTAVLACEPLYASLHMRLLINGIDTRNQAAGWLEKRAAYGERILIGPRGVGWVPFFELSSVRRRQNVFLRSFDEDDLSQAYLLLAGRDDLPPLYALWEYSGVNAQFSTSGSVSDSVLVLWHEHPTRKSNAVDSKQIESMLGAVEWEGEFSPGSFESVVFDWVDQYYLPIGGWDRVTATGPLIKVGYLPVGEANSKPPSAKEFFAILYALRQSMNAHTVGNLRAIAEANGYLVTKGFYIRSFFSPSELYDTLCADLAASFQSLGLQAQAVEYWDQVISIEPNQALPFYYRGLASLDLGRYEEALPYLQAAVNRNPRDASIKRDLDQLSDYLSK